VQVTDAPELAYRVVSRAERREHAVAVVAGAYLGAFDVCARLASTCHGALVLLPAPLRAVVGHADHDVVDGGPHPNPRKAAEGYRLRMLAIDEQAAEVVRRIFAEYLGGLGDRAIANGLNRDGISCPSARRPEQNTHRLADGWQGSTIRSILENPALHRVRGLRPVDQARDAVGSG
jgi:hypothetical protein